MESLEELRKLLKEEQEKRKAEETKRLEAEARIKEEETKRKQADARTNSLLLQSFKSTATTTVRSTTEIYNRCNIEKIEKFDFSIDINLVLNEEKLKNNYEKALKLLEIAKKMAKGKQDEVDIIHPFIHAVLYPVSQILDVDYFGENMTLKKIIPDELTSSFLQLSKRPDAAFCKKDSIFVKVYSSGVKEVRLENDSEIILPIEGKKEIKIPTSGRSKKQKSNTNAFWDAVRYCSAAVVCHLAIPKQYYTILMDEQREISICKVEPEITKDGKIIHHLFHSSKTWKIDGSLTLDQFKELCLALKTAYQANETFEINYNLNDYVIIDGKEWIFSSFLGYSIFKPIYSINNHQWCLKIAQKPSTVDGLQREAEILKNINRQLPLDEHIPKLLFAGNEQYLGWYVCLTDTIGTPLSQIQLPIKDDLFHEQIISQVLQALDTIHKCGYVFVDLHPGNVIIIQENDHNRIVLIDYGSCEEYFMNTNHTAVVPIKDPHPKFKATRTFSSIASLTGYKPIPLDDLESLCYLSYYLQHPTFKWDQCIDTSILVDLKLQFLQSQKFFYLSETQYQQIISRASYTSQNPSFEGFFSFNTLIIREIEEEKDETSKEEKKTRPKKRKTKIKKIKRESKIIEDLNSE